MDPFSPPTNRLRPGSGGAFCVFNPPAPSGTLVREEGTPLTRWMRYMGLVLLLTLAVPATALAFAARQGDRVVVASNEVLDEDLVATGNRIVIDGTVNGDVFAFGREVVVGGEIAGDLIVFAQDVNVTGRVRGDIRSFSQSLSQGGTVDGSVTAFGQRLLLLAAGRVGGTWLAYGEEVALDGEVARDLNGATAVATLAGRVGRDVSLDVENLYIAASARIEGDVAYYSANEAEVEEGARVAGRLERRPPAVGATPTPAARLWSYVLPMLRFAVAGLVLLALFPRAGAAAEATLGRAPLASLLLGFGLLVGAPVAAIILGITRLGLPLALIATAAYLVLLYVGQVPVALFVGHWFTRRSAPDAPPRHWAIPFLAGTLLLYAVRAVPYVGGIVAFLLVCWALGVTALAAFGQGRPSAE